MKTQWKSTELGNVITLHRGYDLPAQKRVDGSYPIYSSSGITGFHNAYSVEDDSVITGRYGTIGEVFYASGKHWPLNTTLYVENFHGNNSKFIYYFMKTLNWKGFSVASAVPGINRNHVHKMMVRIPDLKTQEKIVAVLSPIDEAICNNQNINNNLEEQAKALFAEIIRGKSKNGLLGDYCTIKSGFAFKSAWWRNSGIKVIKIGSINQDYLDLNSCSYVDSDKITLAGDFTVQGGDLLIAMTGATIGKFAMVPKMKETVLVNQRVGKFFLGNNPIKKLPFIYCQLKQDDIYNEIVNRGQGSAQPNISGTDIMSIPCVIPEDDIINDFNATTASLFELIATNQFENQRLAQLRDTLLPKLMSGEIDVSNIQL